MLEASAFGVSVPPETMDLCRDLGIVCPVAPNTLTRGWILYQVGISPSLAGLVSSVNLKIKVLDGAGAEIECSQVSDVAATTTPSTLPPPTAALPACAAPTPCANVGCSGGHDSASSGYASVDYEHSGEQPADVVHLRLLVNKEPVDALTRIVRRSKATALAREMVATMSTEIDRQVVDVAIQAVVDGKVVARETVRAFRKNVLAKCYGGDVTRKKKLLEKQKAGKRRAALVVGEISIPQKAFVAVLAPGKRKGRKRGGS